LIREKKDFEEVIGLGLTITMTHVTSFRIFLFCWEASLFSSYSPSFFLWIIIVFQKEELYTYMKLRNADLYTIKFANWITRSLQTHLKSSCCLYYNKDYI